MKKQVLFIPGGGNDGFNADAPMVASLQNALGDGYEITYPQMPNDENLPDFGWLQQIGQQIAQLPDGAILAGHSLGASMLLKYLAENEVGKNLAAVFLLAAPYWSGDEDWKQGLKLPDGFAKSLPQNIPLFFYHCRDDEEVPFAHLDIYRHHLPSATFTEVEQGGHQFNNDLGIVAGDMKGL